jgi:hypothetical protein
MRMAGCGRPGPRKSSASVRGIPQYRGPTRPVRAKATRTSIKVTAATVTRPRACSHADISSASRSSSRADGASPRVGWSAMRSPNGTPDGERRLRKRAGRFNGFRAADAEEIAQFTADVEALAGVLHQARDENQLLRHELAEHTCAPPTARLPSSRPPLRRAAVPWGVTSTDSRRRQCSPWAATRSGSTPESVLGLLVGGEQPDLRDLVSLDPQHVDAVHRHLGAVALGREVDGNRGQRAVDHGGAG